MTSHENNWILKRLSVQFVSIIHPHAVGAAVLLEKNKQKARSSHLFNCMKRHVTSRQLTVTKQAVDFVLFFFFRVGGSPQPSVSVYGKHGCICACATEEKEHRGQLYLCCRVVVSWQCPSHHSTGVDVGSDRNDLHATSRADTQTCSKPRRTHLHTAGTPLAYLKTQCWFRQNAVMHTHTHTHTKQLRDM